jgi:outer membrane protein
MRDLAPALTGVLLACALPAALAAQATQAAQPARALTLHEAEQLALQRHPAIKAGEALALAAGETVRQAHSAYLPIAAGAVTAADASGLTTRIAAGGLNNPTVIDRFATGIGVSQLVTDFGRTHDLVQSTTLNVESRDKDVDARRADVLLQVDRAYFDALRTQAVLRVAQETVTTRQTVADQVQALANSNLKSSLDVSFAKVSLGEAQLLLVEAQNDVASAQVELSTAIGDPMPATYQLADEGQIAPPPDDSAPLVADALRNRPDIAARRLAADSAAKFAEAERALWMPSLAAVGVAGLTPYHATGITDHYAAAGVNLTIPLSNGGLFNARHAEASFRAQALQEGTRDLEIAVTRDVTMAWLAARTAYQRLDLTRALFAQASDALDLAQARYDLGLSSIVELTQAQLNKTAAEIAQSTARYDYQARLATLRYQTGTLK